MAQMAASLLIDPHELAARLGESGLRVLDATVHLQRDHPGGPYTVESGLPGYERAHIPGAAFADVAGAMSDPDAPHPFILPEPGRFAAAAGEIGIGPESHVVAYSQQSPMWATRLWWMLRHFGFDNVSVLDGGLPAWEAAGLPTAGGREGYPPARFVAEPRPEMLADRHRVQAASAGEMPACLLNALSPEAFRGEQPGAYSRPGPDTGEHQPSLGADDRPRQRPIPATRELERRLGDVGARDLNP